jgi:excinuclease ABC subunit A
MNAPRPPHAEIVIHGARQNNLKNLTLAIPTNQLVVVTGVSGSGKSSLVFDTLYAEGQRRYVETFSPYARQFLDRMDKPQVDRIDGIPPAIAIDQTNPVRTSRSTVGTMTELADHVKLLFARAASLYCRRCARAVTRDTAESIHVELVERARAAGDPRLVVTFPVEVPKNFAVAEVLALLERQGYTRIHARRDGVIDVVQDRYRIGGVERARVIEGLEAALRVGRGRVDVHVVAEAPLVSDGRTPAPTLPLEGGGRSKGAADGGETPSPSQGEGRDGGAAVARSAAVAQPRPLDPPLWRFSSDLHCPHCDIHYREPVPSLFSFNSPIGACDTCRGFGRTIGVDWGLVIPDESKTLREGAMKPWQTQSYKECQDDLVKFAKKRGIPLDVRWRELSPEERDWVIEGEGRWEDGLWYGAKRFFAWLETKAYKMHIRVLLSKYRAYTACPTCDGARLKTEALLWRVGSHEEADRALAGAPRFRPKGVEWSEAALAALPGLSVHDVMLLPVERAREFFAGLDGRAANGAEEYRPPHPHPDLPPGRGKEKDDSPPTPRPPLPASGAGGSVPALRQPALPSSPPPSEGEGRGGGASDGDAHEPGRKDGARDQAAALVLAEIRTRLDYLCNVGLGYLTLDRQSRTLSGGEVQRINLTTALGTSLVNTLFVLDEPSIGLHPRDMGRVIGVMKRLRDAGNSLVVVEHDPQIMLEADRLLDMGPGPGERGGQVVFFGTPDEARRSGTLTAEYLSGRMRADAGLATRTVGPETKSLRVLGASEHNLKAVDVAFPLGRLVCVTGVSGSGKSTLVQDVLYPALLRAKGKPTEQPGAHRELLGHQAITDVVMVDQSPIGRTTRSNPASYVGAWDAIRKRFAASPMAIERGYTTGTFSFNAGDGRCPTCGGNGFEHVEMQFLSDVYLRCPDCDGRRFRPEVLEVKVAGKGIDAVLELTVAEANAFFAGDREIANRLEPLVEVGLEYLRLGQPVPTLSGGEAQRLKLAGHLADARTERGAPRVSERPLLFLFDEPTTGLHFDDVAKLLRALRRLVDAGHSLIVIEHNLDVIGAADWIVDLGPEGGDRGGEVVAVGTPREVMAVARSHTGKALREYLGQIGSEAGAQRDAIRAAAPPPRPSPFQGEGEEQPSPCEGEGHVVSAPCEGEGEERGANAVAAPPPQPSPYEGEGDIPSPYQAEGVIPSPFQGEGQSGGSAGATSHPVARLAVVSRAQEPAPRYLADAIRVHNAREHNLRNVDVAIPRDRFTVITGVSGSGKSTLAFDILFAEGQRRYLESLNAYARQFVQPSSRPDVDAIWGIPPTVAIEQRTSRGGRKSTVATLTEVYHFLRLLYVKLGTQFCPKDDAPIRPQSFDAIAARLMRDYRGRRIGLLAPLVVARKGYYTDLAKWAAAKGYTHLRVDGAFLPTDKWPRLDRFSEHTIELPVADLVVAPEREAELRESLARALDFGKGVVHVLDGLDRLEAAAKRAHGEPRIEVALPMAIFSTKRACPVCGDSFPELDPRLFSFNSKHGWCGTCYGTGLALPGFDAGQSGEEVWWNDWLEGEVHVCPECHGERLNAIARHVRFRDRSVAQLTALPISAVARVFEGLALEGREAEIARDILAELSSRLGFLEDVGLGYLALDRSAPTLSGGEAQRIRLAAQLGSNLQGVAYVLDEPTIGLHPRDNRVLLDTLARLQAKGNTLVVVEHDEDTIRRADHVIDLGPGAGTRGGRVVAEGHADDLVRSPESLTGRFLAQPLRHPLAPRRDVTSRTPAVEVIGATLHNLERVDARIPLGRLVVITGVSGSGKSTLARDVLHANLCRIVGAKPGTETPAPIGCERIVGVEQIGRVLEVDQTPIGKTPRSCPATYVGFWDAIRKLFAGTNEARLRGYAAGRFSFNTAGGRCEACEGQGMQKIEMSFLPDVKVLCDVCRGQRFNAETLAVEFKGRSIGDVLDMSVDDAVEHFAAHPSILHPLKLLQEVGLGYLTLGQQSPTLSGGEAQRIKLVTELAKVRAEVDDAGRRPGRAGAQKHTLYVLDEPTVGLHMADVEKLARVLHRLVGAGNTVVVIEHNLDVMAEADWLIDLGPEGGDAGGRIVAQGSPEKVVERSAQSHTARVLAEFLRERAAPAAVVAPFR